MRYPGLMLLLLLACHTKTPDPADTATTSTGDGLFLHGCPVAGEARARVLTDVGERPWGAEALAEPGDVLLMNSRAAFVIQGPDDPRTYYHYGGGPIDAVAVSGCEQAGPEALEELGFIIGQLDLGDFTASTLHQIRGETIEIIHDGSDGQPAVVEVHGTDDRFWLVELTLVREVYTSGGRKELGDLFGLDVTVRYTLDPDAAALQVDVLLDGEPAQDGFLVGAFNIPSDDTPDTAFSTGALTIGGFNLALGVPWIANGGVDGSTAVAMPGAATALAKVAGVTVMTDANQAATPLTVLGASEPPSTAFLLGVGATDAASAGVPLEPYLPAPVPDRTSGWGDLAGTVVDPTGHPVAGAIVQVYGEAATDDWRLLDRLVTDGTGAYAGRTIDLGTPWRLVATTDIRGDGRDDRDDGAFVDATAGSNTTVPIGAKGALRVEAVDDAGAPISVRVELERASDGVTFIRYTLPTDESVPLPPGSYSAWVSRGYEYDVAEADVTVPEGGTGTLSVTLPHLVDTSGWASFDSHVHAEASPDSTTWNTDRARTVAASGLDAFISTDHEAIVSLAPAIAAEGLSEDFAYALGQEITCTIPEHVNAWPFPETDDPRGSPVRWYGLGFGDVYAEARARGASVVQLNHSRVNGECGILCLLDWDRLTDPPAIEDPTAIGLAAGTEVWSWDFDSFEVMNSLRSPYLDPGDPRHSGALLAWLSFVNLGHPVTGVAVTDVHGLDLPGSPRTWVEVPDDAAVTVEDLATAVLGGQAQFSGGAFARVTVDGAGPGATVDVSGGAVELAIHVEALPGIDVTRVTVLLDCDAVATADATDPGGIVKLDEIVPLMVRRDASVVIVATGEGSMPRGLEDYDAANVPRVVTNPIFLDVDGDGAWTAPGPKACDTALP